MRRRSSCPGIEYPVIRAALSLLLPVLILFQMILSAGAEPAEDAETLRSALQEKYGVAIRMGDECPEDPSNIFQIVITPEGDTAFQQLAYGNRRFLDFLRLLDDTLSAYPPNFFSCFKLTRSYGGLKILLVDDILRDGVSLGGFQSGADTDGKIRIWLSRTNAKERAIHHEIGHAMDYRIRWKYPDAFDDWYRLNPEDFLYTGDFSGTAGENEEPDDFFVREYSKIDEYEDRATVFEALMTKDDAWWETRPYLRRKAELFLEKARDIFGDLPTQK